MRRAAHGLDPQNLFPPDHTGLTDVERGQTRQHRLAARGIAAHLRIGPGVGQDPREGHQIGHQHIGAQNLEPGLFEDLLDHLQGPIVPGGKRLVEHRDKRPGFIVQRRRIKRGPVHATAETDLRHPPLAKLDQQRAQRFQAEGQIHRKSVRRRAFQRADQRCAILRRHNLRRQPAAPCNQRQCHFGVRKWRSVSAVMNSTIRRT